MVLIGDKQYKANLHCHTNLSDGALPPQEVKRIYKDAGYSVLAITDHERPCDHSAMTEDDFVMLTGYEAYIRPGEGCVYDIYKPEIHINLFNRDPHNVDVIGWNDCYCKYVKDPVEKAAMHHYGSEAPRNYSVEYINSFIKTAKEDGYICALNHAVWSLEEFNRLFEYEGFFSMEICNYGSYSEGLPEYNGALYDMFLHRGIRIFAHSADDNHNHLPVGIPGCDSFGGFTMINTQDNVLSYDSVFSSLEKGSFYSSMGPLIHSLEVNGDRVHIETSPVVRIAMIYGGKKTAVARPDEFGQTITAADFTIPAECKYIRFTVADEKGRMADTRGYFRDELGL